MTFPVTQAELLKAVAAAGVPSDYLLDADLVIQDGGRLYFKLTTAALVDGKPHFDDHGIVWETYYYVPFDRLTGEAQH